MVPILLYSLMLLTMALNLLVIISISHFKQLHTPTNLLILSLAFSDFFVGIVACSHIQMSNNCWVFSDIICLLDSWLNLTITSCSIGNIVLISVDRYVAICDPLHYTNKITVRGVQICTSLCWLLSFLYNSLIMWDNFSLPNRFIPCIGSCVLFLNSIIGLIDFVVSFSGPVTVIIVLYMRVFVVAVSHARAMRSHVMQRRTEMVLIKKSELKAAKTLGVVVVVFLLCLFPSYGFNFSQQGGAANISKVSFEIWLFFFNSCVNPLIYAFYYPWFMKSVKIIVTFKVFKPDSCEARIL
ncbi:trace amine-associated receptor 13c-like [Solea senegalensis]|uniref:Trace amine-associated receptor 13c-like n=1 Tax=Solea senegalensis TaxID=28829 RepID=A0AAV6REU4_SOLSE|nr:trace amine-associated receptor 13c-like isoform X1 [Solea senegalensis]KAG7503916.1 trace amine-associated receptor 13c-like [Solea senegalensis]